MHETPLIGIFAGRRQVADLNLSQLDLLVRQARRADVLGKLSVFLQRTEQFDDLPESVRWHFSSAQIVAARHAILVDFEVGLLEETLVSLNVPIVILKGAAYTLAKLPSAEGRLFVDIDIMVPKTSLDAVERELSSAGWIDGTLSEYDQKYYRKWMHELPPKKQEERETLLDVHHAILPETARVHPDSNKLFEAAVPVKGREHLFVLAPEDMVLHSMVHLFHDGEFERGFRDLLDLQGLLEHFTQEADFWGRLQARAVELELARPLYYALYYVQQMAGVSVPDEVFKACEAQGAPAKPLKTLMHALFDRGLLPKHRSCRDGLSGVCDWLLYVRSHYLRMPPHLLIPHLFHKAVITPWEESREAKRLSNQPTIEDFLNKRVQ